MNVRHLDWEAREPVIEVPAGLSETWRHFKFEPVFLAPGSEQVLRGDGDYFYYVANGTVKASTPNMCKPLFEGSFGRSDLESLTIRNDSHSDARILRIHDLAQLGTGRVFYTECIQNVPQVDVNRIGFSQKRLWKACSLPSYLDVSLCDITDGGPPITPTNPFFFYVIGGSGTVTHRLGETMIDRRDYGFSEPEVDVTITGCMTLLVVSM